MMTKRLVHVMAFLMLTSMGVNAQKFSFGVFVDPQLTWFNSDTKRYDPNGPVAGFNIGFSGEKYFAQRYALSSGLSLNTLGGNIRFMQDTFTLKTNDGEYTVTPQTNVKFRAQYLTLPVSLKFRSTQIGYTSFYANVGFKGSIRLKGFAWYSTQNVDREVANDHFAWGFVSYFIGLGMEYSLGGESALQCGLSFSDGLTGMLDTSNGKITSQSLTLRLGIIF